MLHRLFSQLVNHPISSAFTFFPPFCASFNGGVRLNGGIFFGDNYGFRSRKNVFVNSGILVKRGIILTALGRRPTPSGQDRLVPNQVILRRNI